MLIRSLMTLSAIVRNVLRRDRVDRDLHDELRSYYDLIAGERRDEGFEEAQARRAATLEMGGFEPVKEQIRQASAATRVIAFAHDCIFGARSLCKQPRFAAVAVFTLALGIGATTAVFSLIDAVLLQALPYADIDRIVMVWHLPPPAWGTEPVQWGERQFSPFRTARTLEHVAAFKSAFFDLNRDVPRRVDGIMASAELFPILGVQPALGRVYGQDEDVPGNDQFVVISDRLWRREFAASPAIVGQAVVINGLPHVVLGVMPPAFEFPLGAEMPGNFQFPARPDLWVPLGLPAVARAGPDELLVIGKLALNRTLTDAQVDFDGIRDRLDQEYPAAKGWEQARLEPFERQARGNARFELLLLMGAVTLLLLIACTNVSSLTLARGMSRARELSVRHALGATRGRLVQHLLAESLMLSLAGSLGGVLLANGVTRAIVSLAADKVPRIETAHVDLRLLGFALVLAICATMMFGLLPALRIGATEMQESIRSGRSSMSRSHRRTQSTLVIAEVALSMVLLGGAGLLIRSFANVLSAPSGFHGTGVLTFELTLPESIYQDYASRRLMYEKFLGRLSQAPAITIAAMGNLPLTESQDQTVFTTEQSPSLRAGEQPKTEYLIASPNYFRCLGIPLLEGRAFDETDIDERGQPVVIVTKTMADRTWPGQDPIGKRIRLQRNRPWMVVVGLVPDLKLNALRETARNAIFVPYQQHPYPAMSTMQFIVRGRAPLASVTNGIREALNAVDSSLPLAKMQSMDSIVSSSVDGERFAMVLLMVFAGVGAALAATGLYGVLAHYVALQTREIGVRLAIGASPISVLRAIIAKGYRLVIVGAVGGTAVTLIIARSLRGILFGITELDPASYAAAAAALFIVASIACYFPARAAMLVEPLVALRQE